MRARVVIAMVRHEIAFVQFVEDNIWSLVRREVFVDPHFVHWNKWVDKSMSTFGEVDVEEISDNVAAYDPDGKLTSAVLAQRLDVDVAEYFLGV